MKTCILFVTLLIASTYAVQNKPTNFLALGQESFMDDVLEQIKGTPLGRSVSALIRIKMKSGEADFTRLFAAFDQLRQFLNDQTESNKVRATERKQQNKLYLQNQQALYNVVQVKYVAHNLALTQKTNQRTTKQNIFNSNTGTIDQTTTALNLVKSTREANLQAYTLDRAAIVQAIEGCRAAIECLNRLKQEQSAPAVAPAPEAATDATAPVGAETPALIQMSNREQFMGHMVDASTQLSQVKSLKKQSRILKSLIKMSQEYTDQSNLDKVIDLINQLKADLWDKLSALDEAETAAVTNHVQTVESLQTLIDDTVDENTVLGERIAELTVRVDFLTTSTTNKAARMVVIQGRIDGEKTAYALFLEELKADNERIVFELGVLDRAESILAMEGIERREF